METLWERLKRNLGLEQPKPEPKKLTPSEQQAIDKAVPRRFERVPMKSKPKPQEQPIRRRKAAPVKPAPIPMKKSDVTSFGYDFREDA